MSDVKKSISVGRTRRNLRKPSWLTTNIIMAYTLLVIEKAISSTYKKTKTSSESKMWKDAMVKEMNFLHKNDTWELSELSKRKKAIGCKWIFAKKYRSLAGDTISCKARLVAKGYMQREDIDYNKVFLPIVKHSFILILLVLVAQYELELNQLD